MKLKTSLISLLFSSVVAASPINNIVVFGDSLSDNGNLYEYMQHRIPQSPPYFSGRFSNGPVWVEWLTESIFPGHASEHLQDYAIGGAGVSVEVDEDVLFSLHHEVDLYALSHDNKADENDLFVIWIGGNNYLALPEESDDEVIADVIGGTRVDIQRLLDMGAKNMLVINLPDLGRTPFAQGYGAGERLSALTLRHNDAINKMVQDFKVTAPDARWFVYDIHNSVDDVFTSPEKYGLSNVQDTCYDITIDEPSKRMLVKMAAKPGKLAAGNVCEGYLFFDPVHVTEVMHKIVAEQVKSLLIANKLVPA